MPLYIADFEPLALPHAFMDALMKIAAAIGPEAVNPGTALKLLRSYVQPLVPEGHRAAFDLEGQATWERIRMLYPQLACASKGKDKGLMAAAVIVDRLVRHTARPARDVQFPRFAELSSFDRMCSLLRLPVVNPAVQLGLIDLQLYDFCKYCWLPVRSHGVCRYHTTTRSSTVTNDPFPACAVAGLKAANRLSEAFEERLSTLVSAEEWAFHDSEFAVPVLVPPSGLRAWLEQRRPHLSIAVAGARGSNESRIWTDMLTVLYGDFAHQVAEAIGGAVHLLTPISTRAEAWLGAWDSRPRRGGARQRISKRQEPQLVPWSEPIRLVILDWTCCIDQDLNPSESVDSITSIVRTVSSALGVHCEGLTLSEALILLRQQLEVMAEGLLGFEQLQLTLSNARANTIENPADLLNALPMNACIAAMVPQAEVATRLNTLGILFLFEGKLFCLEHPGQGTSRAELLGSAANAMDVQPASCLVLTETPVGVHAARSAGMRVAAFGPPSKHESLRQAGADIVWGG